MDNAKKITVRCRVCESAFVIDDPRDRKEAGGCGTRHIFDKDGKIYITGLDQNSNKGCKHQTVDVVGL